MRYPERKVIPLNSVWRGTVKPATAGDFDWYAQSAPPLRSVLRQELPTRLSLLTFRLSQHNTFFEAAALSCIATMTLVPCGLLVLLIGQHRGFAEMQLLKSQTELLLGAPAMKVLSDTTSNLGGMQRGLPFVLTIGFASIMGLVARIQAGLRVPFTRKSWTKEYNDALSTPSRFHPMLALLQCLLFLATVGLLLPAALMAGGRLLTGIPLSCGVALALTLPLNAVVWAGLYRTFSADNLRWADALCGGVIGTLVTALGYSGLSIFSHTELGTSLGFAGSLLALLLWSYLCAFALLVGGEVASLRFVSRQLFISTSHFR